MTVPSRILNPLHIWFDVIFLLIFIIILLYKKRYMTFLFGFAGGLLYFIVDWGIFYKIMNVRSIMINGVAMSELGKFLFLFWMSLSYGFTNFSLIWLWLKKDKYLKEFTLYILIGWIAVAVAATDLGSNLSVISISRGTGLFHSFMAIFLFISYGGVICYNIFNKKGKKLNILWMLAIGILVQLGWEAALLIGGVRSVGYSAMDTIKTLIVGSLIETNPGVPCVALIQYYLYKRRTEELRPIKNVKTEVFAFNKTLPEQSFEILNETFDETK